jgi:Na+-transporting methylmalonyl-CoA/oxaloacetate decarboxylase gamma subunit
MEQAFQEFIQHSSTVAKAVFLMVSGVAFVFAVQVVFYLIAKCWPRGKGEK